MWKLTPMLLAAAGGGGGSRRRAATTATTATASLPGITPYRFFCAVQRADPILQRKSPPGRVAVLINRFKRLTPQARGGLNRMLQTIKGVAPRKRADKYKELVLSRRRYEGFSTRRTVASSQKKPSTSTSSSAGSSIAKKATTSTKSTTTTSKKSTTTGGSASTTAASSLSKGKRVARLQLMKSRTNRLNKRRRQAAAAAAGSKKGGGGKIVKKKMRQQQPPSASAPFTEHMTFLLYRIRSNKIGPRDAAKLINELRRRFNKF